MSRSIDSKSTEPRVSDLIAERKKNLTRITPVRNLHKAAYFADVPPQGGLGLVTPMQAFQHRHWLRPVTVEDWSPDELAGKAKPKRATKPKEGAQQ
jgi:hypothetical protein